MQTCSTRALWGFPWPLLTRPSVTAAPRAAARQRVALPARLTWKDSSGAVRFASVTTRDVSETGAFVECGAQAPIPLFRLVHLQLETTGSRHRPRCGGAHAGRRMARRVAQDPPGRAVRLRAALPGRARPRAIEAVTPNFAGTMAVA